MGNSSVQGHRSNIIAEFQIIRTHPHPTYQQIKHKRTGQVLYAKQFTPVTQEENQSMKDILKKKISNKCAYVTQVVHWEEYKSEEYCSQGQRFMVLFTNTCAKFKDYANTQAEKSKSIRTEQFLSILQSALKGLKYYSTVSHLHKQINIDCILHNGNRTFLLDPWLCTASSSYPSKARNTSIIYKSPEKQLYQSDEISGYDQLKSNLYELGLLILDLALGDKFTLLCKETHSLKNARINLGYLLQDISDFRLRSKIDILLNVNPQKRMAIYNDDESDKWKSREGEGSFHNNFQRRNPIENIPGKKNITKKKSLSKMFDTSPKMTPNRIFSNQSTPEKIKNTKYFSHKGTPERTPEKKSLPFEINFTQNSPTSIFTYAQMLQTPTQQSQNLPTTHKKSLKPHFNQKSALLTNWPFPHKIINVNTNGNVNLNINMNIQSNQSSRKTEKVGEFREQKMTQEKIGSACSSLTNSPRASSIVKIIPRKIQSNSFHLHNNQPKYPHHSVERAKVNLSFQNNPTFHIRSTPQPQKLILNPLYITPNLINQSPSHVQNHNQSNLIFHSPVTFNSMMKQPSIQNQIVHQPPHFNNPIVHHENPFTIQIQPSIGNKIAFQRQQSSKSRSSKSSPPTPSFQSNKMFVFPILSVVQQQKREREQAMSYLKDKRKDSLQDIGKRSKTAESFEEQQQKSRVVYNDKPKDKRKISSLLQYSNHNDQANLDKIIEEENKLLKLIQKQMGKENKETKNTLQVGMDEDRIAGKPTESIIFLPELTLKDKETTIPQSNVIAEINNYVNNFPDANFNMKSYDRQTFHKKPTLTSVGQKYKEEDSPSPRSPFNKLNNMQKQSPQTSQNKNNESITGLPPIPAPVRAYSIPAPVFNHQNSNMTLNSSPSKIYTIEAPNIKHKPSSELSNIKNVSPNKSKATLGGKLVVSIDSGVTNSAESVIDSAFSVNAFRAGHKLGNRNNSNSKLSNQKSMNDESIMEDIKNQTNDNISQLEKIEQFPSGIIMKELRQLEDANSNLLKVQPLQKLPSFQSNSSMQSVNNYNTNNPNTFQFSSISLPQSSNLAHNSSQKQPNRASNTIIDILGTSNATNTHNKGSTNMDMQSEMQLKYYVVELYPSSNHCLLLPNPIAQGNNHGTIEQRYEGYKQNGCREGHGIYYYKNGTVYQGNWHKGLPHGHGTLFKYKNGIQRCNNHSIAQNKQLFEIIYQGQWINGQYIQTNLNPNPNPNHFSKLSPNKRSIQNIQISIPIYSSYEYCINPTTEYANQNTNQPQQLQMERNVSNTSIANYIMNTNTNINMSNDINKSNDLAISQSEIKNSVEEEVRKLERDKNDNTNTITRSLPHSNTDTSLLNSLVSSTIKNSTIFESQHNQVLRFSNGDIFKGTISTNTMSKAKVITGTIYSITGEMKEGSWQYNEKQNKISNLEQSLDQSIVNLANAMYKIY